MLHEHFSDLLSHRSQVDFAVIGPVTPIDDLDTPIDDLDTPTSLKKLNNEHWQCPGKDVINDEMLQKDCKLWLG